MEKKRQGCFALLRFIVLACTLKWPGKKCGRFSRLSSLGSMHYLIQRYALSKHSDRSMISKSIIFRTPQCFSPMIVFFLILGGLASQMN